MSTPRRNLQLILGSLAAHVLFGANAATAQEPAQSAADPSSGAGGLQEVVVTAQRRTESVLKVPLSVTVVSGDTLVDRGANDLTAVTTLTPSLQVAQDNTFSIRGVGTATFSTTVESSVSQVIDDVVLGNNEFAANALYDVARVEVLNGPQGLLFGKNASAGLVNITTNRPRLGEVSEAADVELVSRDRPVRHGQGVQFRDTLNLPVTNSSALRFNLVYSSQAPITYPDVNPAVRNDTGVHDMGARAKYLFEPSDDLSLYVIGDYNQQKGISGRYDVTFRSFGPQSQYLPLGLAAGVDNLLYQTDAPNYRDSKNGGVQANVSYGLANGMRLVNIAAWKEENVSFQFDSDNTPVNFFDDNQARQVYHQVSEELRLALPDGIRWSGQFGLYYYHSLDSSAGLRGGNNGLPSFVASGFPFCIGATQLGAPPLACPVDNSFFLGQDYRFSLTQNSYATFGQVGYKVTDDLKLNAGGRVTHDRASIDLLENVGSYFVTLGVPNNHSIQSTDATNFSFKLGADWQLTPATMLYGFYGRGYKGPGFSNTAPAPGANLAVRPEISNGGELGIKGRLFSDRVTYSLAGFYTRFTDLQIQAFVQTLRAFVLSNAATASTRGVDLSVQARATDHLTLMASAAYVDARFDDYPGAQCYPTQTSDGCHANVNASDPGFVGVFNAKGYPLPLSSRFTASLGADYAQPLTDSLAGVLGLGFYHRSPEFSGIGAPFTIPSWNTLDMHLGVKAQHWDLSVFCKNCTNEIRPLQIAADAGDANPLAGPPVLTLSQHWSYNSVRTIGLRGGINF